MNWDDFLKEFREKFNNPYIPGLIVGFSGIDPSQKGAGESTQLELTDEQLQPEEMPKAQPMPFRNRFWGYPEGATVFSIQLPAHSYIGLGY